MKLHKRITAATYDFPDGSRDTVLSMRDYFDIIGELCGYEFLRDFQQDLIALVANDTYNAAPTEPIRNDNVVAAIKDLGTCIVDNIGERIDKLQSDDIITSDAAQGIKSVVSDEVKSVLFDEYNIDEIAYEATRDIVNVVKNVM